jgi:hypothetical protein
MPSAPSALLAQLGLELPQRLYHFRLGDVRRKAQKLGQPLGRFVAQQDVVHVDILVVLVLVFLILVLLVLLVRVLPIHLVLVLARLLDLVVVRLLGLLGIAHLSHRRGRGR